MANRSASVSQWTMSALRTSTDHMPGTRQMATWSMSSSAWMPVRWPGPPFWPMKSSTVSAREGIVAAAQGRPGAGGHRGEGLQVCAVEVGADLHPHQPRPGVDPAREGVGVGVVGEPQPRDPLDLLLTARRAVADGQVALDQVDRLPLDVRVRRGLAEGHGAVADRDHGEHLRPGCPVELDHCVRVEPARAGHGEHGTVEGVAELAHGAAGRHRAGQRPERSG